MRITPNGNFRFCRWADNTQITNQPNIATTHPLTFFQKDMASVRQDMLEGKTISACNECKIMEQHGKISGRQKQLLKTGIVIDNFVKTAASSTFRTEFEQTEIDLNPVDWQIDLGNHCNGACVFCTPDSSSRLAAEFYKIGFIDRMPARSWVEDPASVDKFISTLVSTPNLAYLHFLGGETLITPGFRTMLQALITAGLHSRVIIGLTTNLTVWDNDINQLLTQFREVNLGVSIETMDHVNDYVRWPSRINLVLETLERWRVIAKKHDWIMSLRITPTVLTASRVVSLYQYAVDYNLGIESCNFLNNPAFMRTSILPMSYRLLVAEQLQKWIDTQTISNTKIVNIRDLNHAADAAVQDATSYLQYLKNAPDESDRLPALVEYLKKLEKSRSNSVLDYLPEYEQIFRSAGY
jgi:sulfatase maturation enzyme AslB (radical SAM superfamily)